MPRYTTAQRVELVQLYYTNGQNSSVAARLFNVNNNTNIDRKTVSRLVNKFSDRGSVADAPRSGRPLLKTEDKKN